MNNEKQKILDMLEKGTITPADAAKLLECLGESQREETALVRQSAQRMKGKKLRVQVEGSTEESEDLRVNVSVPLVLARYADKEGNPLYPVPVLMDSEELEQFYYLLMEKET